MLTAAQNAASSADRIATACDETHPPFERIPPIRPRLTRGRPVERKRAAGNLDLSDGVPPRDTG
jgi:hypothetical protein